MKPPRWDAIPVERLGEGCERQVIWGDKTTTARFRFRSGSHVSHHSHESEQVTCLLEGSMRLVVDGRPQTLRPGDVFVIPSWAEHEAWFLEDTLVLDVFSPPRDDWKAGKSQYLAGQPHDPPC